MQLDEILQLELDATVKGLPAGIASPFSVKDIRSAGWNLLRDSIPTPFATLDRAQMHYNSRWMRLFTERHGVQLCPHGKTTMAPQLFKLQIDDGAFGITVATTQQMQVCRKYGVRRILLANQLVGRSEMLHVFQELDADPELSFFCLIDSAGNLQELHDVARRFGLKRPLQVLLELGLPGGRTGCRGIAQAIALAKRIADCAPYVELVGIEGFEGIIEHQDPDCAREAVNLFVRQVATLIHELMALGVFKSTRPVLSLGGSIYFDLVVLHPDIQRLRSCCDIVLRSGCYISHDSHMLMDNFDLIRQRSPELDSLGGPPGPALSVWGRVHSRPESGLALVNIGKRDISYDIHLPVAEYWYRKGLHAHPVGVYKQFITTQINDQHLFLDIPQDADIVVGDLMAFGVSHPCTTFDKWKLIYVVDEQYDIVDGILTFF